MDGVEAPVLIEVGSSALGAACRAFEAWAGGEGVVAFFDPDTMLAVDRPGRRGFLRDQVYFVTLWAAAGGQELLDHLRAESLTPTINPSPGASNPAATLALILAHGSPLPEVRHLL